MLSWALSSFCLKNFILKFEKHEHDEVLKWHWLLHEARYWALLSLLQGSYAALPAALPTFKAGSVEGGSGPGGTHPHEGRSELSLRQIGTKSLSYRAGSEWTDDPTADQDPLLRLEETGREDSSCLHSATFPHDGEPVRMKPTGGSRAGYGQKLGSGASSGAPAWSCAPGLSFKTSVAWLCCQVATESPKW